MKIEKLFEKGWALKLSPFLASDEFKEIGRSLVKAKEAGPVYPEFDQIFRSLNLCSWQDLKVVFLTNTGFTKEMDGLAFSVSKDFEKLPKCCTWFLHSLEVEAGNGQHRNDTDLSDLAEQGVLLLNLDLSSGIKPGTHLELWEPFINFVIQTINEYNSGIVFVLIGKQAMKYKNKIDSTIHDIYILEHPMVAINEKRAWDSQDIFNTVNRVCKFLNNTEIKWI